MAKHFPSQDFTYCKVRRLVPMRSMSSTYRTRKVTTIPPAMTYTQVSHPRLVANMLGGATWGKHWIKVIGILNNTKKYNTNFTVIYYKLY